ncbi:hypothetical protein BsWGS_14803 [Bradybaena similaris]
MADHTASVACLPRKSESSLIPPSTTLAVHRHGNGPLSHSHAHCHLSGNNNLGSQHNHSHCSHFTKGDGLVKDGVICEKSFTVEGSKVQCNGCLQVGADFEFCKRVGHCQNGNMLNISSDELEAYNAGCHPQNVANTKCVEMVNGLSNSIAEHSSGDSPLLLSLLNPHKAGEGAAEIENQNHNCSTCVESVHASQFVCRCRHLKSKDAASHGEIVKASECSPSVQCRTENSDSLDALVVELQKASLCHDRSFSERPESSSVISEVTYLVYESERQMPNIMRLITKDLSEPYSIYTYRYFIHNWPNLCFLAVADDKCIGAIVCKLDLHKKMVRRGYIAMLAVDSEYRRRQIGSTLVTKAIEAMIRDDCDEVVLETEITNQGALRLYEKLGFVRDKRLFRYYLNGVDALRLKLWLR